MSNLNLGILGLAIIVQGCSSPAPNNTMTPDEAYRHYNQRLIEGLSFEESREFHSVEMNDKVTKKIQSMKTAGGDDAFDKIISSYLSMIQAAAKCSELILSSETIENDTALLVYDRKDICNGDNVKKGGERIRMVDEKGWKIDDNTSVY